MIHYERCFSSQAVLRYCDDLEMGTCMGLGMGWLADGNSFEAIDS
jgi:hypothetical protein